MLFSQRGLPGSWRGIQWSPQSMVFHLSRSATEKCILIFPAKWCDVSRSALRRCPQPASRGSSKGHMTVCLRLHAGLCSLVLACNALTHPSLKLRFLLFNCGDFWEWCDLNSESISIRFCAHHDEQSGTMQYDVWCRDALTAFYGKFTLSMHPQGSGCSDVETLDSMNNKSSLNIDEM